MIKLKEGTKAEVIYNKTNSFNIGDIVTYVGGGMEDDDYRFEDKYGTTQYLLENQFKLIEDKFKVGDLIKGTNEHYGITNKDMYLGEIIGIYDDDIEIKIIEHKLSLYVGKTQLAIFVKDEYFEIIEQIGDTDLKLGTKVKVIENDAGHDFEIGDIVELSKLEDDGIHGFVNNEGEEWYMVTSDYEILDLYTSNNSELNIVHGCMATFIMIGDYTISIPKSTPIGISSKHPDDEYSEEIGQAIAYYRLSKERGL